MSGSSEKEIFKIGDTVEAIDSGILRRKKKTLKIGEIIGFDTRDYVRIKWEDEHSTMHISTKMITKILIKTYTRKYEF